MSFYVHPTKQLRDDELPPELVVTNQDRSIEQVYVPYNASDHLKAENAKLLESNKKWMGKAARFEEKNAKLRELVQKMMRFFEDDDWCTTCEVAKECEEQEQYEEDCLMRGVFHDRMRELGVVE